MKLIRLIFICIPFVFYLTSCTPKPKDVIIGKWEVLRDNNAIGYWDFSQDGKITITPPPGVGKISTYDYSFTDEDTISIPGNELDILISGNEMTLTSKMPSGAPPMKLRKVN